MLGGRVERSDVIETCFRQYIHMFVEREMAVKRHSKQFDMIGKRYNGVSDIDGYNVTI